MINPINSLNDNDLQTINIRNAITSQKSCIQNLIHDDSVNDHTFKLVIINCQSIVGKRSI